MVERTRKFADGELRGERSLCVLPPSKHRNGRSYQWLIPLPDGPISAVDPETCGLIPPTELQTRTEEDRGKQRQADANLSNLMAFSWQDLICKCEDQLEIAISVTLATGPRQRNRQVFQLARALKGIPGLASIDPRKLKRYVKEWHKRALPHISTKPFEETWADFLYGWPRVTHPMRLNLLEDAMKLGIQNYPAGGEYEQEGLRKLLALCCGLQAVVGDQPFFLATRTAGRLLGVTHTTAWRWLFLLEQDGWITTVQTAETKENPYKATRFRYLGGQKGQ